MSEEAVIIRRAPSLFACSFLVGGTGRGERVPLCNEAAADGLSGVTVGFTWCRRSGTGKRSCAR